MVCRSVRVDLRDQDAAVVVNADLCALGAGQIVRNEADVAAYHPAVFLEFLDHASHEVDRDGEADALGGRVLRQDRRVDPDQFAVGVDQGATRIAGVDRRIRLYEILERRELERRAAGGADDALRDGLREAVRVANRQHHVADPEPPGTAEADCRQGMSIDLQECEVGLCVQANDLRSHKSAVTELDLDLRGVHDDVPVRDQVAVRVDDDGRGEAGVDAKTRMAGGVGFAGDQPPADDRDHGRCARFDGIRVAGGATRLGRPQRGQQVRAHQNHDKGHREARHDRLQQEQQCRLHALTARSSPCSPQELRR